MTVAMWGNDGELMERSMKIRRRFTDLYCFKVTAKGEPHHTRGLPNGLKPQLLSGKNP